MVGLSSPLSVEDQAAWVDPKEGKRKEDGGKKIKPVQNWHCSSKADIDQFFSLVDAYISTLRHFKNIKWKLKCI